MRWLDSSTNSMDMNLSKAPRDSERQGRLAYCSPWGHKELDRTYQLSNNFSRGSKGKKDILCMTFEGSKKINSVTQSCPALCDPMDCSTPGFSVHHQLPEFTQTHVHRVGDTIQPSHPLLSPSPPAFNLSQHQCLFK